jgi:hypothetical protein
MKREEKRGFKNLICVLESEVKIKTKMKEEREKMNILNLFVTTVGKGH